MTINNTLLRSVADTIMKQIVMQLKMTISDPILTQICLLIQHIEEIHNIINTRGTSWVDLLMVCSATRAAAGQSLLKQKP